MLLLLFLQLAYTFLVSLGAAIRGGWCGGVAPRRGSRSGRWGRGAGVPFSRSRHHINKTEQQSVSRCCCQRYCSYCAVVVSDVAAVIIVVVAVVVVVVVSAASAGHAQCQ